MGQGEGGTWDMGHTPLLRRGVPCPSVPQWVAMHEHLTHPVDRLLYRPVYRSTNGGIIMAMYKGNRDLSDEWEELFELREMYGSEWSVFARDTDPTGRYLSVKLLADDYVENKANYWMSWDKQRKRLTSRGLDAKLLKDNRPELYKFVVKNLEYLA
jgi:hypothetical protein